MGLKEELQETNNKAFNTWFDRWWDSYNLEKKMRAAASKGFIGQQIDCDIGDDYTKGRLRDDRTVSKIKEKLGDVKVERVIDKGVIWSKIPYKHNKIIISWGKEDVD